MNCNNKITRIIDKLVLRNLGAWVLINIIVVCFVERNCGLMQQSDDFFITSMLCGANKFSSSYVLVCEHPFSYLIKELYSCFSRINWFGVIELFSIIMAFAIFELILFDTIDGINKLFSFFVALLILPIVLTSMHYTLCSILASFAGMLYIIYSICKKKKWFHRVIGAVVMMIGASFRFGGFCLCVPYIFLILVYLWRCEKNRKEIQKVVICLACVSFLIMCQHTFTKLMYDRNDAIVWYKEFNSARAAAFDWLPDDYSEELMHAGMTENDYQMVKRYIIYDDVFSYDYFNNIAQVNKNWNRSPKEKIIHFKNEFLNKVMKYQQGRYKGKMSLIFVYLFIFLPVVINFDKKNAVFIISCNLMTALIAGYFVWIGRFPPWVQDGLYIVASINNLLLFRTRYERKNVLKYVLRGGIIVCVFASGLWSWRNMSERKAIEDTDLDSLLAYTCENADGIFIIDNIACIPHQFLDYEGMFSNMGAGSWKNMIRAGSWFIEHPVMNWQLAQLGIDSPIRNLLNDNVYLISNTNTNNIQYYIAFFSEHYGISAQCCKIEEIGNYSVYKFDY